MCDASHGVDTDQLLGGPACLRPQALSGPPFRKSGLRSLRIGVYGHGLADGPPHGKDPISLSAE